MRSSVIRNIKSLGVKKLPTINIFLEVQDRKLRKKASKEILYTNLMEFVKDLKKVPKITDFIDYDLKGFQVQDNKPIFKGWTVCEETSSETKKVPTLKTKNNVYKIYFDTKDGVIISSETHMSDQLTYNDLAYFFEGNLELS